MRSESGGDSDPIAVAVRASWQILGSIHFAVALIFVLAVVGIVGVLVPQAPVDVMSDQASFSIWLETVARPELGSLVEPVEFFGLFNVFHSFWMTALGVLLVASIIACTARRLASVKASAAGLTSVGAASFYDAADAITISSSLSRGHALERTRSALKAARFHVTESSREGTVFLAADKYRFAGLGTLLSHAGLVVLLAGVVIGARYGFYDETLVIAEGMVRDVGNGTGLSIELVDFADEYWEDGTPRDFRSDVIIYRDGMVAADGTIRVNHPLRCDGVRFYQGFFGPAPALRIQDESGSVLYEGAVPLSGYSGQPVSRASGLVALASTDVVVSVVSHSAALGSDDPIGPNQLGIELYEASSGMPLGWALLDKAAIAKAGDFLVTYEEDRQFAGLQARRDPGTPLVWLGCGMLVLGMGVVLYFPRRSARLRLTPRGQLVRVDLRLVHGRGSARRAELRGLRERLTISLEADSVERERPSR